MEEIGAQVLNTAAYHLPDSVLQAIDTVTQDDVVNVSAFTAKITIGVEIILVIFTYTAIALTLHLRLIEFLHSVNVFLWEYT